jgi:hypothetical protein
VPCRCRSPDESSRNGPAPPSHTRHSPQIQRRFTLRVRLRRTRRAARQKLAQRVNAGKSPKTIPNAVGATQSRDITPHPVTATTPHPPRSELYEGQFTLFAERDGPC